MIAHDAIAECKFIAFAVKDVNNFLLSSFVNDIGFGKAVT